MKTSHGLHFCIRYGKDTLSPSQTDNLDFTFGSDLARMLCPTPDDENLSWTTRHHFHITLPSTPKWKIVVDNLDFTFKSDLVRMLSRHLTPQISWKWKHLMDNLDFTRDFCCGCICNRSDVEIFQYIFFCFCAYWWLKLLIFFYLWTWILFIFWRSCRVLQLCAVVID